MAQITGLLEKQRALSDIERKIKSLEPLNRFLQSENPDNEYAISFGNIKKTPLLCKDKNILNELVQAYKEPIVKEINELATAYSITLDEDDLKAMNETYVPVKQKSAAAE